MNLSADQNLHEQVKFIKSRSGSVSPRPAASENELDVIDVSDIKFESDETWLYKPNSTCNTPIKDLSSWLYSDNLHDADYCITAPKHEFHKNIDTRTFTRPKKRFARPSIEKYNEEVYGSGSDSNEKLPILDSMKHVNMHGANESSTSIPLNFDLTQPTNSYYFENILANSEEIESFQNMSPPSLVNSMCSSTFANLMDSSFIKNDPVLRGIRDTDYTETVLLQDSEPPMFQSITESYSSINSDTPESFLKKVSFNGTFRRSMAKDLDKINNSTLNLNTTYEDSNENDRHNTDVSIEGSHTPVGNCNGTYRRMPKSHGTFRKSDMTNPTLVLNSTYEKSKDTALEQNTTQTLIKDCSIKSFEGKRFPNGRFINHEDTVEDMKKQLSETVQITDLNRLSYCLEDDVRLESTYTEEDDLNRTVNMNRSALGCSTGSADSLDRMSSLSTSSRESNKMLNMADVDAIVEMQERSLQQVMSTPKPNGGRKELWENNLISPIIPPDHLSDSDPSSNDEYKSARSAVSKTSLENYTSKSTKSLGHLGSKVDLEKANPRSAFTLTSQKPLQAMPNNMRGSYSNLKTIQSNIPGSQPCLYKSGNNVRPSGPTSNLKTMGHRLKGSYTSLRPISANLPVAPPPITSQLNVTTTLSRATNPNVTRNIEGYAKVVQVQPMPRERANVMGDSIFVKPQQPRASGLPRPTGIPRPASRIPGPRSNLRPVSSRSASLRQPANDL